MLEILRKLNPDIEIYSIHDEKFKTYGKFLDIDTDEIVNICKKIQLPQEGSLYLMQEKELENAKNANKIKEMLFGTLDAQIGLCMGYNSYLNALEYHNSSEINIAATDLVLILAHRYEMDKDNRLDSKKAVAFYLKKGDAVEVFATTMHFCPCQVFDDGFLCVVVLPKGTNDILDKESDDKLLFKKNKWIICHEDNTSLIERNVQSGIYGPNYEIKY